MLRTTFSRLFLLLVSLIYLAACGGGGGGGGDPTPVPPPATNGAPQFVSTPETTATESSPYSYDADASDPEQDSLSFSLASAPSGMTIDESTGVIEWTPETAQVGDVSVVVQVSDGTNVTDQSFTINVAAALVVGRDVVFAGPEPVDMALLNTLPKDPNGDPIIAESSELTLVFDANLNDAITAKAGCINWITSCLSPPDRTLDDCARSAPRCQTSTPWEEDAMCCPASCFGGYEAQRRAGISDLNAIRSVYGRDAECFPGVAELLK